MPNSARPQLARTRSGDKLLRVTAPHFVAGAVARDGRIVHAAPILRRLIGEDGRTFVAICKRFGWSWEIIDQSKGGDAIAKATKHR